MRGLGKYSNLALQVFVLLISFCIALPSLSEARKTRHRPAAVVVGTVSCDTSRHVNDVSKTGHFISGATISVKCNDGAFKAIAKTNKHGKFKLPLPSTIVAQHQIDTIKGCQVSLVRSRDPYCAVASTATSSSIRHLINPRDNSHVFTAGLFTFKPGYRDGIGAQKNLLDPITNGPFLGLGPVLQPIMPQLPPLPPLLGIPNPLQPPSPPSFSFPGGVPGFSGLTPSTPPAFPIPFPPGIPSAARKASP